MREKKEDIKNLQKELITLVNSKDTFWILEKARAKKKQLINELEKAEKIDMENFQRLITM